MIIRAVLLVGAVLSTNSASAQSSPVMDSSMELSVAPYFSFDQALPIAARAPDSVESAIFQKHQQAAEKSKSAKSLSVKTSIYNTADLAVDNVKSYRRVTCSDTTCEIVIVVPTVDGSSEHAQSIISRFHDRLAKKEGSYRISGPSMILEGSNTAKGFTILYYVDLI